MLGADFRQALSEVKIFKIGISLAELSYHFSISLCFALSRTGDQESRANIIINHQHALIVTYDLSAHFTLVQSFSYLCSVRLFLAGNEYEVSAAKVLKLEYYE